MAVIDFTSPLAHGLGAAGEIVDSARTTSERHAAAAQAQQAGAQRIQALQQAQDWATQDRARSQSERQARLESITRQFYDQAAQGLQGPILQNGVGDSMRQQQSAVPSGIRQQQLADQALAARMSPEDAAQFLAERNAGYRQQLIQHEQTSVMRDIETAYREGLFGQDEGGDATFQNLVEIAKKDPVAARQSLLQLQKSHAREITLQLGRERALTKAQEALQMAEQMGAQDWAIADVHTLIGEFQAIQSMDPEGFLKELRGKLFAPDARPKIQVPGLDKDVPDYSGWARGGYIEDMDGRQKAELKQVATLIVRKEWEAKNKGADAMLDRLAPGEPPPPGAPPQRTFEEDVTAKVGDLMAMFGWVQMPDEEAFRREYSAAEPMFGDQGWQGAYQGMKQSQQRQQRDSDALLQSSAQQPSWEQFKTSDPQMADRALQMLGNLKRQGGSLDDARRLAVELGVNLDTIPDAALQGYQPKGEGQQRASVEQSAQEKLRQAESYPLTEPKDLERLRGEAAAAQESARNYERALKDGRETLKPETSKTLGYLGTLPAGEDPSQFPALVEVYVRWLKVMAANDTDKGKSAKATEALQRVLAYQKFAGIDRQWTDEELRAQYAEESKRALRPGPFGGPLRGH